MEPIIAKCGYRCDLCPAFEANVKGDEDKQDFQRALQQYYGCDIPLEEIKACRGCQAAEKSPDPDCQVYPCVCQKGIPNCGHCEAFGQCDKLKQRMDAVEDVFAKQKNLPADDYDRYFKPYLSRNRLAQIHNALEK